MGPRLPWFIGQLHESAKESGGVECHLFLLQGADLTYNSRAAENTFKFFSAEANAWEPVIVTTPFCKEAFP